MPAPQTNEHVPAQPTPTDPSAVQRPGPSIGIVMLEWFLSVIVGWIGASIIAMVVIYFVVAENDRQIAIPFGLFLGFLSGAVLGAKTRFIRLPRRS
jgi:hypothetical protein